MNGYPKTFDELREQVWEEKRDTIEMFVDRIDDETTMQDVHRFKGEIMAFDSVLQMLRNIIKYGDCDA